MKIIIVIQYSVALCTLNLYSKQKIATRIYENIFLKKKISAIACLASV